MTTKSVSIRKIQRAPRPTTGFVQPRIVWRRGATRMLICSVRCTRDAAMRKEMTLCRHTLLALIVQHQ